MRLTRLLLTFTCALTLWGQTAVDWRFAHPQATMVGSIRPAALLQSPLLKTAMNQAAPKDPQVEMGLAIAQTMLRGITEIRFSIMDNGSPTPDSLILVTGTMDPTTLAMLQGQGAAKMETHSVDANTLLIGTGSSLKAAVARLNAPASDLPSAALLQARQITTGHDFWIAGQMPKIAGLTMPQGFDLDLRSFAIGLSLTDNVGLEVAAQTATAAQAEALVKMVRDAEAKQPAGGAHPEISVQGTMARLSVSVPADEVMQAMKSPALAGLIGGGAVAQAEPLRPLPPPKPAKPSRGTVIIEGLEGGTLEIPIQAPQALPGTVQ